MNEKTSKEIANAILDLAIELLNRQLTGDIDQASEQTAVVLDDAYAIISDVSAGYDSARMDGATC